MEELQEKVSENLIDNLASQILQATPIITKEVAFASASSLFSSVLPYIRLETSLGLLPLAELDMIIGHSGVGKTLPFNNVRKITERLRIKLAERWTVPGIEKHFMETPTPYGMMTIDELGQFFGLAKSRSYMSGSIEQISQFFDMHLKSTALATGNRYPQDPYVSILSGTIPQALIDIPESFFTQGLAGRFYFTYAEPMPKPPDIDIGDYESHKKVKGSLDDFFYVLRELLEINAKHIEYLKWCHRAFIAFLNKEPLPPEPERKIQTISIDKKSSDLWYKQFEKEYKTWLDEQRLFPQAYHWQYVRRLSELSLRQAGKFAIGRKENIKRIFKNKSFNGIVVNEEDMQRGIDRSMYNHKCIIYLIKLRDDLILQSKGDATIDKHYSYKSIVRALKKLPHQMGNDRQICQSCKMDYHTYKKYKDEAITKGAIIKVDKSKIENEDLRRLLKADEHRTQVWTIKKE